MVLWSRTKFFGSNLWTDKYLSPAACLSVCDSKGARRKTRNLVSLFFFFFIPDPAQRIKRHRIREKEKKRNSVSKISCNSRPSTTYNCTLCEKKGLGYKNFLYHFGKKHYMCLLKKVHKGMTSCCGKCAKMHSDDIKLIGHLIIEHGALKEELKGGYLTS